jgi:hypothetical protein
VKLRCENEVGHPLVLSRRKREGKKGKIRDDVNTAKTAEN